MCTCTHVSLYGLRQFSVISSLQTGIIAAAGPGMRTAPSRTRRCSCSAAALLCKMRTNARIFIANEGDREASMKILAAARVLRF